VGFFMGVDPEPLF